MARDLHIPTLRAELMGMKDWAGYTFLVKVWPDGDRSLCICATFNRDEIGFRRCVGYVPVAKADFLKELNRLIILHSGVDPEPVKRKKAKKVA